MRNFFVTAVIAFIVGTTASLACDMGEADNLCKEGQVFDPQKGECQDASV